MVRAAVQLRPVQQSCAAFEGVPWVNLCKHRLCQAASLNALLLLLLWLLISTACSVRRRRCSPCWQPPPLLAAHFVDWGND
jgi:hypothetical protein